jgi:hypothetical protein
MYAFVSPVAGFGAGGARAKAPAPSNILYIFFLKRKPFNVNNKIIFFLNYFFLSLSILFINPFKP